jgi:hypothetical protein
MSGADGTTFRRSSSGSKAQRADISKSDPDEWMDPCAAGTFHDFKTAEEFLPIYLTGFESCASSPS